MRERAQPLRSFQQDDAAVDRGVKGTVGVVPMPRITVITPVKNGSLYLQDLLHSVQQQDYPFVEHIVIDDGSNDGGATLRILKATTSTRWWSRVNRGQVATQNEGLRAATGDIVTILCSDDMYADDGVLSAVAQSWRQGMKVLYGETLDMGPDGKLLSYQTQHVGPVAPHELLIESLVQHSSVFIDRQFIYQRRLWFDESFRLAGDWEWLIRVFAAARDDVVYIPRVVSVLRHHSLQTSRCASFTDYEAERLRVVQMHGGSVTAYQYAKHNAIRRSRNLKARGLLREGGVRKLGRAAGSWLLVRIRRKRKPVQSGQCEP